VTISRNQKLLTRSSLPLLQRSPENHRYHSPQMTVSEVTRVAVRATEPSCETFDLRQIPPYWLLSGNIPIDSIRVDFTAGNLCFMTESTLDINSLDKSSGGSPEDQSPTINTARPRIEPRLGRRPYLRESRRYNSRTHHVPRLIEFWMEWQLIHLYHREPRSHSLKFLKGP